MTVQKHYFTRIVFLISIFCLFTSSLAFGASVSYQYDELNRLIRAEYSNGAIIEYSYDLAGNRISKMIQAADPKIEIRQGESIIANGGSYDFGTVVVGSSATAIFTIRNSGGSPLELTNSPDSVQLSDDADFALTSAQPASPIAPGASESFEITFSPAAAGARSALLSIANSDNDENPYSVTLHGNDYETGDINGDGLINIFDLQLMINCILGSGSCERCDLNEDGLYNIFDLQLVINLILGA